MGHHYIPREYLRGFESPVEVETIWTFDKKLGTNKQLPIPVVAQEAGFYDEEVEGELSRTIEGPGHRVLQNLRRGQPMTGDDRLRLALYIGSMMMRVPSRRQSALELVPGVIDKTIGRVRETITEWATQPDADQALIAQRMNELDALAERYKTKTPAPITAAIRAPWPSMKVIQHIYAMVWRIVRAPETDSFLTSDNPAYFFKWNGLGKPQSELIFPLSSTLALAGNWRGQPGSLLVTHLNGALVREFNRRVASGAARFVFYHACKPWVETVATKRPYLSQINW